MAEVTRQFVSILAADCVGFSKHMLDNEEMTLESLKSCRMIIDGYINDHGGRIFHTAGDSVLAEFRSPIEAVNCAIKFQDRICERNEIVNSKVEKALTWRVGIHCDEVIFEGQNIYGNGVNIAARLESQCPAGQILVSRAINEQVVERISAISNAVGEKKLKNISDSFEVFSISTEKTAKLTTQVEQNSNTTKSKAKKPTVSMIPFKNLNADEDSAFLIDGIFEDILTEFSMVRQLSVVSRQSSVNFHESSANLESFISQFGVDFLVDGSVRSAGSRVRVTANLIQADTQRILWSKKFDKTLHDIFEVQDEIVRGVTTEVLGEIELASLNRSKRKPTENMTSYEYLLRGKEGHHTISAEANATALKMFDAAIEADPNNAQAYAWKACTLGQAMVRGYDDRAMPEIMKEFEHLMASALSIDPHDFECHRLQCAVNTMMGNMQAALDHGKKAYEAVPNDPRILQQYGEVLLKTGDTTKGCDLMLLALQYDPIAQGQTNSDKRKSDVLFGCLLDDRPKLGLEIASEIHDLSAKDVMYAATLAIDFSGSFDLHSWLILNIQKHKKEEFIAEVEQMGKIDLVLQSKMNEVYADSILPLCA
jgi:adenylate cyclase